MQAYTKHRFNIVANKIKQILTNMIISSCSANLYAKWKKKEIKLLFFVKFGGQNVQLFYLLFDNIFFLFYRRGRRRTIGLSSWCSFSMMVKWANDGLPQANDGKMLVNDGEMLVNDGEISV